ncbi:TIGR04255 family protein [Marinobacter metalliresistant]|uniref:TIGR04255 family protein n=1 Tax=Marinobacter metalliresistant TaxID=2961995 RepID=A0ABZ2VXB9_9GAMM
MPGQYRKPPLIYVTATIHTVEIPELDSNGDRELHHAMVRAGLTERRQSTTSGYNLEELTRAAQGGTSLQNVRKELTRKGFFNADHSECLILDPNYLEYRVTKYEKYQTFIDRLAEIVRAVNSVDIIGYIDVREIILTYCDAIIPVYGTELSQYFNADSSVLPLDFIKNHQPNDVFQAGQLQVTRVIRPNEKISIHLEQLPYDKNSTISKPTKWLTGPVIEPDPKLNMQLRPREEWVTQPRNDQYFGLLTIRASKIYQKRMADFNVADAFASAHEITKETFIQVINKPVCDQDWEFIDN